MEQALDKIGSFDVSKVVLDINSHKVYDSMFVAAFQPSGWMDSIILHGQCLIWNEQCHFHNSS